MSTSTAGPVAGEPRTAFVLAAAVHAITLLTNARLHDDLARYAHSAELIVLPAANPGHIPPTDFGHAGQLITRALAATRTALAARTPNPPAAAVTPAGLRLAGPGGQATRGVGKTAVTRYTRLRCPKSGTTPAGWLRIFGGSPGRG